MILISLGMRAVRFSELAIHLQMSLNTFFGHEMLVLLGLLVRLRYNDNLVCFRLLSGRGALPGCCHLGGGGRRPAVQPEGKSKANITRKKTKNIQAIDLIFNNLVFFLLRGVYLHSGRQHATCASPRIGNRGERPLMQFNKGFISNMLVKRYQLVLTLTQYN